MLLLNFKFVSITYYQAKRSYILFIYRIWYLISPFDLHKLSCFCFDESYITLQFTYVYTVNLKCQSRLCKFHP